MENIYMYTDEMKKKRSTDTFISWDKHRFSLLTCPFSSTGFSFHLELTIFETTEK